MNGFAGASSMNVRVAPLDAVRRDFAGRSAPGLDEVVMRGMILTAVAYRGWSEVRERTAEARQDTAEQLLAWSRRAGMTPYLEADEARILTAAVGSLSHDECMGAAWRIEGAVVLAWAAQLIVLPGYWELARLPDVMDALQGMPRGLAEAGPLRPECDVVSVMRSAMSLISLLTRYDTLEKFDVEALMLFEDRGFEEIYRCLDDRDTMVRAAFERAKATRWLTGMSQSYAEVAVPHGDCALL